MSEEETTSVVRRYPDELAADSPAEPLVRALMDRAVRRLHRLCATPRHRSDPRQTHPPVNLRADEGLGAVAERLLKALRTRSPSQDGAPALRAGQPDMRRELKDPARRLDDQPAVAELCQGLVPAPVSRGSGLTPDGDVGRTMAGSTDSVRLISQ
jgi:RNA polymerase sigma-70 factor (ECF subfamily)